MNFFIIQKSLMAQYSELREKRLILQYYVSLDYPQRQKKLIDWWGMMIQSAVKVSNQIYLSPADLQQIFTLHGLKPVPLEQVLNILQHHDKLQWRNRDKIIDRDEQNISFIKRIIGVFLPQKSNKQKLSRYISLQNEKNSKIISSNLLKQKTGAIKQIIQQQIHNQKFFSFTQIIQKIQQRNSLSRDSIIFIVNQLQIKSWIKIQEIDGQKVIIFSETLQDYQSKVWVDIQKQKFILKHHIKELNKKLEAKQKQKDKKYQLARNVVQRDKLKAKQYLGQVKNINQSIQKIENRVKVLEQSLSQLQTSEQNKKTTQILQKVSTIIQQNPVDMERFDSLRQQSMQTKFQQDQINNKFQQINNINVDEDAVNDMLNQLQNENRKNKLGKKRIEYSNNRSKNNQDEDQYKNILRTL